MKEKKEKNIDTYIDGVKKLTDDERAQADAVNGTLEVSENRTGPKIDIKNMGPKERKAIIVKMLIEKGLSQADAARMLGVSSSYVCHMLRRQKKRGGGLLAPLVPLAQQSLTRLLQGLPVGAASQVSAQAVLRAIEIVLEREAPAVQRSASVQVTARVDVSAEERERIIAALRQQVAPPPAG